MFKPPAALGSERPTRRSSWGWTVAGRFDPTVSLQPLAVGNDFMMQGPISFFGLKSQRENFTPISSFFCSGLKQSFETFPALQCPWSSCRRVQLEKYEASKLECEGQKEMNRLKNLKSWSLCSFFPLLWGNIVCLFSESGVCVCVCLNMFGVGNILAVCPPGSWNLYREDEDNEDGGRGLQLREAPSRRGNYEVK